MVLQSKALICQGDSRQCRPRVRKKVNVRMSGRDFVFIRGD